MSMNTTYDPYKKQRGYEKLSRIPIKIEKTLKPLPKPDWLRIKLPTTEKASKLKEMFRDKKLFTVCEEATCPNLSECFSSGIATFMIMGDKCTRRCAFCDVGHGRPDPLDVDEPKHLAETVQSMNLRYVVITSVDRDDLRDGGAGHFVDCIKAVRVAVPHIKIEVLVPDFRGRMEVALDVMSQALPDVFNHNVETVPSLYKAVRPGSGYQWSLDLLKQFYLRHKDIPTKSGLMLGLGETFDELIKVMKDMREHSISMLTLGQYLQPSPYHYPVKRYVTPTEFDELGDIAKELGFTHVASGPLVRSSYHADKQALGEKVS